MENEGIAEFQWLNVLGGLSSVSSPSAVAVVLRHCATGRRVANSMDKQFTKDEEKLAMQVGKQLKKALDRAGLHLVAARSSAYPHTVANCEALLAGAESELTVTEDTLLGNPSIFVKDAKTAEKVFKKPGHDYCVEALIRGKKLPGWSADPRADAKALLYHLMESIPKQNGVGLFVTHDIVIGAMVSLLLGRRLKLTDLPGHLDGAVFLRGEDGNTEVRYGDYTGRCR